MKARGTPAKVNTSVPICLCSKLDSKHHGSGTFMCSNRFLWSSSGRAGTMSRAALACLFGLHLPNSTGCSMKVSVSVSSLELCVGSTAFLWGLHTGSGAALRAHISRLCRMCCSRDKLISTHTKQQTWAGGGGVCLLLCGSSWYSWVWCFQLSGGNVGGEMLQKEEEGGRKGTVWCRDFWKEFFHPHVISSSSKDRVNVSEWLPEWPVFCSQVFVFHGLLR